MEKIRIGIIGCGHWGPNFVRNFSQMPEVEICGVCDLSQERLASIRNLHKGTKTYTDYGAFLRKAKLDAVVISTPAATHFAVAREALARNLHILVEKPLSVNAGQAEKLVKMAGDAGKVFMVGHTFLYNPAVKKIKAIIASKELGKIYYIHTRRTNLGPLRKDVNAIWDLSPHDISIINYVLGQLPGEVSAYGQRFLSHGLEDVGFITLKYPKEVLAHIHVSWLDPKKIREMTIIGSKKMLVYEDTDINEPIKLYDKSVMKKRYEKEYRTFRDFQLIIKNGEINALKVDMQEPLRIECRHFVDCIVHHRRPLTTAEDGLNIVKILEAIDGSLASHNAKVKIPWK
jgi:predicted dehydrogenase